ncbi:hypothetical protein [Streptomyces sp. NBC_01803]|uniref:hypothetical protein n=1 Tax=Streptomyces sp. NBC_01803 TaxID=2975946 RepID=UPI002DD9E408|nr:hypothetical protein [Streptomyces sp. NBC_01803]WSA44317.1 hypothetical protein OIE51_08925 [Streptomyces sp. NBC_01803]
MAEEERGPQGREARQRARVRAAVLRLVDAAPPLSVRQRERLRLVFRAVRRRRRDSGADEAPDEDATG